MRRSALYLSPFFSLVFMLVPQYALCLSFPVNYYTLMDVTRSFENQYGSAECNTQDALYMTFNNDGTVHVRVEGRKTRYTYTGGPPECQVLDEWHTLVTDGTHDKQGNFSLNKIYGVEIEGTCDDEGVTGGGGTNTSSMRIGDLETTIEVAISLQSILLGCPSPAGIAKEVYCRESEFLEASPAGTFSGKRDGGPFRFDPCAEAVGFEIENSGQSDVKINMSAGGRYDTGDVLGYDLTIPRESSVFVGVTFKDPAYWLNLALPSGCNLNKKYSVSVIDVSSNSELSYTYKDGQAFHIYAKAAPNKMNWILLEASDILPGTWFARPSDDHCRQHQQYLYVFALDPAVLGLPDEADLWVWGPRSQPNIKHPLLGFQDGKGGPNNLFYAESFTGEKLDVGYLSASKELGRLVIRTAEGNLDPPPSLNTIQEISLTPSP